MNSYRTVTRIVIDFIHLSETIECINFIFFTADFEQYSNFILDYYIISFCNAKLLNGVID